MKNMVCRPACKRLDSTDMPSKGNHVRYAPNRLLVNTIDGLQSENTLLPY